MVSVAICEECHRRNGEGFRLIWDGYENPAKRVLVCMGKRRASGKAGMHNLIRIDGPIPPECLFAAEQVVSREETEQ